MKVIVWLFSNFASIVALIQALLKAVKEVGTALVNLLSLLIPKAKAESAVKGLRAIVNAIDSFLETIKKALLK